MDKQNWQWCTIKDQTWCLKKNVIYEVDMNFHGHEYRPVRYYKNIAGGKQSWYAYVETKNIIVLTNEQKEVLELVYK